MSQLWSLTTSGPASNAPPGSEPPMSPTSSRIRYQGKRFAQIVKLKPEFVDKYKEVHAQVWPEVLKQIRDCNIHDCT